MTASDCYHISTEKEEGISLTYKPNIFWLYILTEICIKDLKNCKEIWILLFICCLVMVQGSYSEMILSVLWDTEK